MARGWWRAQIKDFARVADSIIGWGSSVGRWARIDNKSVIGEDVHVKARALNPKPEARTPKCLFPGPRTLWFSKQWQARR